MKTLAYSDRFGSCPAAYTTRAEIAWSTPGPVHPLAMSAPIWRNTSVVPLEAKTACGSASIRSRKTDIVVTALSVAAVHGSTDVDGVVDVTAGSVATGAPADPCVDVGPLEALLGAAEQAVDAHRHPMTTTTRRATADVLVLCMSPMILIVIYMADTVAARGGLHRKKTHADCIGEGALDGTGRDRTMADRQPRPTPFRSRVLEAVPGGADHRGNHLAHLKARRQLGRPRLVPEAYSGGRAGRVLRIGSSTICAPRHQGEVSTGRLKGDLTSPPIDVWRRTVSVMWMRFPTTLGERR